MTTETYPYPQRPSELVKNFCSQFSETKRTLTLQQRMQIQMFEEPLFLELKEIKEQDVEDHVIYPGAFTTEEGRKLFKAVYLNPDISNIHDSDEFFDGILKSDDNEVPKIGEVSELDVVNLFEGVDLKKIPKRLRERMNIYSSKWAEEKFRSDFIKAKGNTELILNPKRVRRIVDPEIYRERMKGLRSLKFSLKQIRKGLLRQDAVSEAKIQICDLYQKYINVQIAQNLEYEGDVDSPKRPRRMQRMDHFLKGVGLEYDKNGLLQTIPVDLVSYSRKRLSQIPVGETSDFVKYNSVLVDADGAKAIADRVLGSYGLLEGANAWRAVVLERNSGVAVMFDKNEGKREVRIPRGYKRGLVSTLALLAHEIEGHVLRFANKESSFEGDLLFTREFNTGRSAILSEGAAMWLEDEAKEKMVGMKDPALPYYYVVLIEKQKGGSFKECVRASLVERARQEYSMSFDELFNDSEKFGKVFDKAYSSTLRIFRRFTSFDDRSGYITISETLDYIEQELVVDFLMSHPDSAVLSKILFVAGIDLYSIYELLSIGVLDLSRVKIPKRVILNEIWPKLKKNLDSGQNIKQAIESIT